MKDQGRIELLKAVAECAPKEMGARVHQYGEVITLDVPVVADGFPRMASLTLTNNSDDARGIIALLDAMRMRESELTQLVATHSDKELMAMGCEHAASELFRVRAVLNELTWRNLSGEAVARAFVAVFGGGK